MPAVNREHNKKGDFLVDYEEKVFEDVKAEPGQKALVTFHTVAFEGSIGLVNLLQATRLQRKGFDTSILLYGPGITLGVQRGFRGSATRRFRATSTSTTSWKNSWPRAERSMPAGSRPRRCTATARPPSSRGSA